MISMRKFLIGSAVMLALAGGAAGLAVANSASAASGSTDTTVAAADDSTTAPVADSTTESGVSTDAPRAAPSGPHAANGITEEVLTGDTAAKVQAAVVAALPDAKIERLETDAEGAVYEAHVTLADGSDATVKLDANFTITGTVQGHG